VKVAGQATPLLECARGLWEAKASAASGKRAPQWFFLTARTPHNNRLESHVHGIKKRGLVSCSKSGDSQPC